MKRSMIFLALAAAVFACAPAFATAHSAQAAQGQRAMDPPDPSSPIPTGSALPSPMATPT